MDFRPRLCLLLLALAATLSAQDSERGLVAALHQKISAAATPAAMESYQATVPGSGVSFQMAPIPGGEIAMGSPAGEPGRRGDEGPPRTVQLDSFWMGVHEVTWDIYRLFMFSKLADEADAKDELVDGVSRPTPPYVEMSFGMGVQGYPAISMTQHAAAKFTQWLSAKTGHFYRLPTEAEWEYACRAGTTSAYSFGDDPAHLGEYAWHFGNSEFQYRQVGKKKPNPWGLHDMHGNVAEWTLDAYDPSGYPAAPLLNPWVRPQALYPRVARGGSWNDDPDRLRCAARLGSDESWKMQDPQLPKSIWYHTDAQWLGLRVVRPLKMPTAAEMYEFWNSGLANSQ